MLHRFGIIAALVLVCCAAASSADPAPGARTAASSIHILGSFNGWDESLWTTDPGMTFDGAVWRGTVSIGALYVDDGFQQFKFVTDRAWDSPPDYVLCPDRLDEYQLLSGPVCLIPGGVNLQMYADIPGRYEMTLDEVAMHYEARLLEPFTARITGHVVSAADPSVIPAATIWTFFAGGSGSIALARTTTDPATGAFELSRLEAGTYAMWIEAPGFVGALEGDFTVGPGGATDTGTLTLEPITGCQSAFTAIQVVGDFNGWNTSVASMTQVSPCVWEQTLDVAAGCFYMKFRTNNTWGNDYGTCTVQDPNCLVPLSGPTCLVNGENALGKINFARADSYLFHLDEQTGTYSITPTSTSSVRSTWGRLKIRYR